MSTLDKVVYVNYIEHNQAFRGRTESTWHRSSLRSCHGHNELARLNTWPTKDTHLSPNPKPTVMPLWSIWRSSSEDSFIIIDVQNILVSSRLQDKLLEKINILGSTENSRLEIIYVQHVETPEAPFGKIGNYLLCWKTGEWKGISEAIQ